MDKKDAFKLFIGKHPEVLTFIKNKEMTFQDFYEIYDIYGEDEKTWNKYFKGVKDSRIDELSGLLKNVNMDNIEHHINNAQKIISVIQELTTKSTTDVTSIETPITKIYGD